MNEPQIPPVVSARDCAAGCERYCLESAAQPFLLQAALLLQRTFGFQPAREPTPEDLVVRGRINNTLKFDLSWNNWFGFQIVAGHERSNPMMREIADYFDRIKDDPTLAKYFQ